MCSAGQGWELSSLVSLLPPRAPHHILSTCMGWRGDWRWEDLERLHAFLLNGGGKSWLSTRLPLNHPSGSAHGVRGTLITARRKSRPSTRPTQGDPTGMKCWLPALLAFSHIPGWERGHLPVPWCGWRLHQSTFAGGRGTTVFFCGDCLEQLLIKVFCLAGLPLSWSFGQEREQADFLLGLLLSVPLGVSGFSSTPFGSFFGPQGSSSVFCLPSELLCVFPCKSKVFSYN